MGTWWHNSCCDRNGSDHLNACLITHHHEEKRRTEEKNWFWWHWNGLSSNERIPSSPSKRSSWAIDQLFGAYNLNLNAIISSQTHPLYAGSTFGDLPHPPTSETHYNLSRQCQSVPLFIPSSGSTKELSIQVTKFYFDFFISVFFSSPYLSSGPFAAVRFEGLRCWCWRARWGKHY